jgi:protease-4
MFNFSEIMGKVGVQSLTLTDGKDKDMLNPFRPWGPGEDASLKAVVSALYQRFVSVVTHARPQLDKEKLITDYGAQIYVADEAKDLGYIDVSGADYNATLRDLAKAAGIGEEEPYQVVELAPPHSIFREFVVGRSPLITGKITHSFQVSPYMSSDLNGKFLYLYQP